jgi:HSP20 family molecular chaperone IbpA
MQPELVAAMCDQVRTIYRAATGSDLPEPFSSEPEPEVPLDEVTRRFVELEVMTRTVPSVAERVPPFSFSPPLDVISSTADEIVVELALPGVDRTDITVDTSDETLLVAGFRREPPAAGDRTYSHAEIPRGPFYRAFRLPFPTQSEPAVELDRGILRVRLERTRDLAAESAR